MSDALIASLQAEINRLNAEVADLRAEAKDHRLGKGKARRELEAVAAREAEAARAHAEEVEALRKQVEDTLAARDALQEKLDTAPDQWRAKLETAEAQLRARDHRDAWARAVGAELHEKVSVEKLWSEVDYQPEGEVDPTRIDELVNAAREAAPYLFKPAGAPAQRRQQTPAAEPRGSQRPAAPVPFDTGLAGGRGGRDTSSAGMYRVRESDLSDPLWMRDNQARLAEARRNGTFQVIPGQ
jgi:hypothetical protein